LSRKTRVVLGTIAAACILGTAALPLLPAVPIGPWVLMTMIVGLGLLHGVVRRRDELVRLTEHDRRPLS
jgi:hypothetical protein